MSENEQEIFEAAKEPKSVSIDGVRVDQHSLADRVAAARFVQEQAASTDPFASIGHRQLRFGGPK